jgi:hypothetical protein
MLRKCIHLAYGRATSFPSGRVALCATQANGRRANPFLRSENGWMQQPTQMPPICEGRRAHHFPRSLAHQKDPATSSHTAAHIQLHPHHVIRQVFACLHHQQHLVLTLPGLISSERRAHPSLLLCRPSVGLIALRFPVVQQLCRCPLHAFPLPCFHLVDPSFSLYFYPSPVVQLSHHPVLHHLFLRCLYLPRFCSGCRI